MVELPEGVELVEYREGMDGHRHIQMAVRGQLAPAIDDHIENRFRFSSEAAYFAYVAKRSEEFIHLFGDARYPLCEDEINKRSQEPF